MKASEVISRTGNAAWGVAIIAGALSVVSWGVQCIESAFAPAKKDSTPSTTTPTETTE